MTRLRKIALFIIYPALAIAAIVIAGFAWALGLALLIVIGIGGCAVALVHPIDGVHEPGPDPPPDQPSTPAAAQMHADRSTPGVDVYA